MCISNENNSLPKLNKYRQTIINKKTQKSVKHTSLTNVYTKKKKKKKKKKQILNKI